MLPEYRLAAVPLASLDRDSFEGLTKGHQKDRNVSGLRQRYRARLDGSAEGAALTRQTVLQANRSRMRANQEQTSCSAF